MFFDDLEAVDETALRRIAENQVAENLTLEFKRELSLDTKEEKREAAKDISAMANTVGGQILYGVAEKKLADGSKVASAIMQLTDGAVDSQLADVLANGVHPRVYPTMRKVAIAKGGFVLIVQVRRSYADLHMVIGYETFRYYKRDAKGTVPMTEPEVRQEYERIALAKVSLDTKLSEVIEAEARVRGALDESIIVVPWYSSPTFLDPRTIEPLGQRLRTEVLVGLNDSVRFGDLRLMADGYRKTTLNKPVQTADVYIAVLRTGVMHLSDRDALRWSSENQDLMVFYSVPAIIRIVELLMVARYVCKYVNYWAPVRLAYFLRPTKPFVIDPTPWNDPPMVQPLLLRATPVDVRFDETKSIGRATKEILDQIFQAAGRAESPYFDADGVMVEAHRQHFPEPIVRRLL
ncbi:MAG TPA: ATP-binding protein [Vicinamibacteria bacterium]|nr:ATP-binding protein [Vicinamibacteria bacterium]